MIKNKDLLESASKHHEFYLLQVGHLLSVLDEIEEIGEPLVAKVAQNAKERHELDKMIFAKKMFDR